MRGGNVSITHGRSGRSGSRQSDMTPPSFILRRFAVNVLLCGAAAGTQAQSQPVAPAAGQPGAQGTQNTRPARYEGTGPIIDYTGKRSDAPQYGFATSGSRSRTYDTTKPLDQRIEEEQRRQRDAKQREDDAKRRAFEARERSIELDKLRIEREARLRLENDKRKLQELERENNRR